MNKIRSAKVCQAALLGVVVITFCNRQFILAQSFYQGNRYRGQTSGPSTGMFGNRTLGQSFIPAASTFGGGIQTGASGNFLYIGRSDGSAAFASPWRQIDTGALDRANGRPDAPSAPNIVFNAAPLQQSSAPGQNLQVMPGSQYSAQATYGSINGSEDAVRVQPVFAPTPAGGPRSAIIQPYIRSPILSERLTRIARSKGALSASNIDVYMRNSSALVQGTVPTEADGALLSSVLALEPGLQHIDNRLIIETPR
jgi:hypothetical protein